MFFRTLKRTSLATLAALALTAATTVQAGPGDLTVVNSSAIGIHPYFKSNCWNPAFTQGPGEWVFFGYIAQNSQFTWTFAELLDPKCKNPVVKFSFNHNGEAPPTSTDQDRTVIMQFDATEDAVIRLGNKVVVTESP
jgi:hypothetical protein